MRAALVLTVLAVGCVEAWAQPRPVRDAGVRPRVMRACVEEIRGCVATRGPTW
jgi:hypothetical protein